MSYISGEYVLASSGGQDRYWFSSWRNRPRVYGRLAPMRSEIDLFSPPLWNTSPVYRRTESVGITAWHISSGFALRSSGQSRLPEQPVLHRSLQWSLWLPKSYWTEVRCLSACTYPRPINRGESAAYLERVWVWWFALNGAEFADKMALETHIERWWSPLSLSNWCRSTRYSKNCRD